MKQATLFLSLALAMGAGPLMADEPAGMKGMFAIEPHPAAAPVKPVVPAIPAPNAAKPKVSAPDPAEIGLFAPVTEKPAAQASTKKPKPKPRVVRRAEVQKPVRPVVQPVADDTPPARERVQTTADLVLKTSPLPLSDRARLEASRKWEAEGVADALVGTGGQVEYAYGQSRPTISCAPLHICTIQFIAGESITSMSLGDTVRWLAQATTAGQRPVIVVKPTQPGISTNMVVTTDQGRVYYMHLLASKTEYVPMVGFYDPAGLITDMREQAAKATEAKAKAEAIAAAAKAKRDQAVVAKVGPGFDPAKLDFSYTCEGEESFKPVRVFASDTHIYIQMAPDLKAQDAPALFNASQGSTELMNTRFDRGYYILDGKPGKFQLALGVGREARVVECKKDATRAGKLVGFFGGE